MIKKEISGDIEKCLNEINCTSESIHSKLYMKCIVFNYIMLISAFAVLACMYLEQSKLLSFLINNYPSEIYVAQSPPVIEIIFLLLFIAVLISFVGMLYIRKDLIVKYISARGKREEDKSLKN